MRIKTTKDRRHRIHLRSRKRLTGTAARPRLAVFRSSTNIYVQAIDDVAGQTVAAASSLEAAVKAGFTNGARGANRQGATAVGKVIAERLQAKGITTAVFDRGGFLYHGRVRAVAEAAREAGLTF
jgi:large subunit ribosomal protein L18